MWLSLAFLSAALLGCYDVFKKHSLRDNAVIPVLLLNTVFCSLFFLPFILVMVGAVGYVASYLASDITSYRSQTVQNLNITYFYILIVFVFTIFLQKKNLYIKVTSYNKMRH